MSNKVGRVQIRGLERVPLTRAILRDRDESVFAALIWCIDQRHDADTDSWADFLRTGKYHGRAARVPQPIPPEPEPEPIKLPPPRFERHTHAKRKWKKTLRRDLRKIIRPLAPKFIGQVVMPVPPNEFEQKALDWIREQFQAKGQPLYMHFPQWVLERLNEELIAEYHWCKVSHPRQEIVFNTDTLRFVALPVKLDPVRVCPMCYAEHRTENEKCPRCVEMSKRWSL